MITYHQDLWNHSFLSITGSANKTLRTIEYFQGHNVDEKYAGSFNHTRDRPTLLLMILASTALYAWFTWRNVQVSVYGFSYYRVITQGEFWRVFAALLAHEDSLHFIFDTFMLWSAGALELRIGSLKFCTYTVCMSISTAVLYCVACKLLSRRFDLDSSFHEYYTVGTSPIIFGYLTILSYKQNRFDIPLFPGLLLPLSFAPVILLFVASLIINRSKFLQHAFGILSGMFIELGAVEWINGYWLGNVLLWVIGLTIISIKCTTCVRVYGLKVYVWPFEIAGQESNQDGSTSRIDDTNVHVLESNGRSNFHLERGAAAEIGSELFVVVDRNLLS